MTGSSIEEPEPLAEILFTSVTAYWHRNITAFPQGISGRSRLYFGADNLPQRTGKASNRKLKEGSLPSGRLIGNGQAGSRQRVTRILHDDRKSALDLHHTPVRKSRIPKRFRIAQRPGEESWRDAGAARGKEKPAARRSQR